MVILAIFTIILVISIGTILLVFAEEIGKTFFFELIPGFGITNLVEKYILMRKPKNSDEKPGMFLYIWLIRLFGCLWIIFAFFITYIVIFSD